MSVINTNVSSMQAQNSVRTQGLSLSTAMERLSSGIRINSAKDDAAGLAISTRMTASIRGISAAIRNANDGISLTQTAEGSLNQISDNLQRIRELAVQAANTGNNASDRAAMNNEATQLIAEIDRVASNTTYNGIALLDGSFQNQNLQVGAGNGSNDRIAISIDSAKSSSLGVGATSSYETTLYGAEVGTAALEDGALAINGYTVGAAVADGVSYTGDDSSAIAVAATHRNARVIRARTRG
jgi:flagellin